MANLVEKLKSRISKRTRLIRNREVLEDFLGKNCGFSFFTSIFKENAYKNNNYLIKNLADNEKILELVNSSEDLKNNLFYRLANLPHTYRLKVDPYYDNKNKYQYSEWLYNVKKLSTAQLLRVWTIMEALEKKDFKDHIGNLVENDLNDPYTEHGGLILFNEGLLRLLNVESTLAKQKDVRNKNSYLIPNGISKLPHIAKYHIHALFEDSSNYAGPSQGFPFPNIIGFAGDLASAHLEAILDNESHNVVITKLRDQKFNMDYYGCEAVLNGKNLEYPYVVLDLGDYEYGK